MSKHSLIFCINCGENGHSTKVCSYPITSFGTIVFRIKSAWDQAENLLGPSINSLESVPQSDIQYLLIRRRDSLGYIDIMRGKYKLGDIDYISQQVRGMTTAEHTKLLAEPFDVLWEQLWGPPINGSNPYRHEKEQSRLKLEALINAPVANLKSIIDSVGKGWDTPEWGFPKGRRDPHESEFACALREMWEETGLSENDVIPIKNIEPLRELFFGSNNIQYCHKYYILFEPYGKEVVYDPTNAIMQREIGDIRWCSLEEGLALIRPENVEKREILLRVSRLLAKYCPFQNGGLEPCRKYPRVS